MTDEQLYNHVNKLPGQIESARRKFMALIRDARGHGLTDLANEAWDALIIDAQADARSRGGSIGFGEYRRGVDEL